MEGKKILKLKPGKIVEVIKVEGFYVLVRSEGKKGWIHRNKVKLD